MKEKSMAAFVRVQLEKGVDDVHSLFKILNKKQENYNSGTVRNTFYRERKKHNARSRK